MSGLDTASHAAVRRYRRDSQRVRRSKAKARGLCGRCATRTPAPNRKCCSTCLKVARVRYNARNVARDIS
jgi:hypothetical protein